MQHQLRLPPAPAATPTRSLSNGGAHPGRAEQRSEGGQRAGGGRGRRRGRAGRESLQRRQLALVRHQVSVEQLRQSGGHVGEPLVRGGAAEQAGRARLQVTGLPESAELLQGLTGEVGRWSAGLVDHREMSERTEMSFQCATE